MLEKRKSIRSKLRRVILITSSAVLMLTFTSYFIYEFFSYREFTLSQLHAVSSVIAANSTAALAFNDQDDAIEILNGLSRSAYIEKACLYDSVGNVFAVHPVNSSAQEFPAISKADKVEFSGDYVTVFTQVHQNEKRLGTLFIQRSLTDLYSRLGLYTLIALIVMVVSFLLAYSLSARFQDQISGPIISLAETTRRVSFNHDYSIRAEKSSDDEIGVLTDAFNRMLGQIEIQNQEIQLAREVAQQHALELERKVQERTKEYRTQKEFAESILNSSLVLLAVFDTERRIIAFNNKCEEEFGVSRDQVLGKKLDEALPRSRESQTYRNLLRGLHGQSVHTPEFISPVTGKYYESFTVPLRDEKGEVYAVLLSAHNITAMVEAREKLRQTNIELMRKNSELEQFAYVASHDLQEPLRKIQTFIQLVMRDLHQPLEAEKYLAKIETSAKRMSVLIRDVLEYSRLSQVQESFREVNLNIVIEYVLSDLELLISQKQAEIYYDTMPTINGNRLQLHQLFANLTNNSLKFSVEKPVIRLTVRPLSVDEINQRSELDPSLNYVHIEFTDNGIGFEQEYADKIFTIFQRLNTREKFEGTGIGLALCKKIVENHFGHISAKSAPGKGTTFTIILPTDAKNVSMTPVTT